MSEVSRPRLLFFTVIVTVLLLGYICLVLTKHEAEAQRIGELLSIVVIALVTYYLGYSQRQRRELQNPRFREKYGHITKKNISRLGFFFLGVGVALLVSHAVLFGIDLELKELLLGHEWIGLFVIIISMYMIGISKKLNK